MGQEIRGDDLALAQCLGEFVPFLDDDVEIRKMICYTNGIESLNARYRRAIRARGHSQPSRPQ